MFRLCVKVLCKSNEFECPLLQPDNVRCAFVIYCVRKNQEVCEPIVNGGGYMNVGQELTGGRRECRNMQGIRRDRFRQANEVDSTGSASNPRVDDT